MNIAMNVSESREFEQFVSCFANPARAVEFWNFWPSESVLCCEKRGQPQFCHTVIASGALCCGLANWQTPANSVAGSRSLPDRNELLRDGASLDVSATG